MQCRGNRAAGFAAAIRGANSGHSIDLQQRPSRRCGAVALGLHVRVGIEDNRWKRKGDRMTSVQQVEQFVRIARDVEDHAAGVSARTKTPRDVTRYMRRGA